MTTTTVKNVFDLLVTKEGLTAQECAAEFAKGALTLPQFVELQESLTAKATAAALEVGKAQGKAEASNGAVFGTTAMSVQGDGKILVRPGCGAEFKGSLATAVIVLLNAEKFESLVRQAAVSPHDEVKNQSGRKDKNGNVSKDEYTSYRATRVDCNGQRKPVLLGYDKRTIDLVQQYAAKLNERDKNGK